MATVILFSQLTETNKNTILPMLFPKEHTNKSFAYMPSGGILDSEEYMTQWKNIANEYGARMSVIDNTSTSPKEPEKLLNADVLLISGGNTFQLLSNLRKSGLDKAIVEFSHRRDTILAGFSAGALILTPTITICNLPGLNENLIGLDNFNGLGIVDFELFPHYEKRLHESILSEYQKTTSNRVLEITDEQHVSVSL